MREVVYIPLPLNLKVRLKAAMAILIPNVAHLVGSVIVFALTVLSGTMWQMAVAGIGGIWLLSAWRVTQLYVRIGNTRFTESAPAADAV